MNPQLIGNPLIAWRDDRTLQVGWGDHGLVVESAPARLPDLIAAMNGSRSRAELLDLAQRLGIPQHEAAGLVEQMRQSGLLRGQPRTLRVSIAGDALIVEPLTVALQQAGVAVVARAEVVVFPQGQVPSLVAAPAAGRLVPVWFSATAVHVGPVLDEAAGPCARCVDLTWSDHDPLWPRLVAQSTSLGLCSDASQITQAAALISVVGCAAGTVGLEVIADLAAPGPRWRVWSPHPACGCHQK